MDRSPGLPVTGTLLLVGPDGAGKSTVLEELDRLVGAEGLARAHLRPGLIAGGSGDGSPVTDPHSQPPRGPVSSLVKLAVVWLDTVLGGWLRWRPAARRRLLVVERGWYDQVVDPRRYRLPERLRPLIGALGRLTPRADLAVVLTGDPAAFHRRKPEIGEFEVARQLATWRALAPLAARRVVEVDTVEQSGRASAEAILQALTAPDRPRWRRVPAAPRRLDLRATGPSAALQVYRPFSARARLAVRANDALLRLRLAPRSGPPPVPRLAALLDALPVGSQHLAAFRSSGADRWVIGVAEGRTLRAVVKVGRPDNAGLATELATLRRLTSAPGLQVPEVLWSEQADDRLAVAYAALPPLGDEPSLDAVVELCTRLVRGDLGRPVVHGDLAPWNLALIGDDVAVWDWEDARTDVIAPLHDLTHYVIRAGLLLGRWDAARAARMLTDSAGVGATHLRELGLDPATARRHVEQYLATTSPSSRVEATYRETLSRHLTS